jgi:hypothetical protein
MLTAPELCGSRVAAHPPSPELAGRSQEIRGLCRLPPQAWPLCPALGSYSLGGGAAADPQGDRRVDMSSQGAITPPSCHTTVDILFRKPLDLAGSIVHTCPGLAPAPRPA